jgi:hypothetical protein
MKRLFATLLIAIFVSLPGTACREDKNPLKEEVFVSTVQSRMKLAKERFQQLKLAEIFSPPIDATKVLFEQPEAGNGAEFYGKVLQDYQQATSEKVKNFVDSTLPILQVLDLTVREQSKTKLSPKSLEVIKEDVAKLIAMPELAEFEKGAQYKESQLIGVVMPFPDNLMKVSVIPLGVLNGFAGVMMCKGLSEEEQGNKAAAEKWMQAIVAFGNHLSQEPNKYYFVAGNNIMKLGCVGLKNFYERQENTVRQEAVVELERSIDGLFERLGRFEPKDDYGTFDVVDTLGYLDDGVENLVAIASNEAVALGIRAKALENIYSGYIFRYVMAIRSGRPTESAQYADPSEIRIQALQKLTSLPDKTLADMAGKGVTFLNKLKSMNNAERVKYLIESAR